MDARFCSIALADTDKYRVSYEKSLFKAYFMQNYVAYVHLYKRICDAQPHDNASCYFKRNYL